MKHQNATFNVPNCADTAVRRYKGLRTFEEKEAYHTFLLKNPDVEGYVFEPVDRLFWEDRKLQNI